MSISNDEYITEEDFDIDNSSGNINGRRWINSEEKRKSFPPYTQQKSESTPDLGPVPAKTSSFEDVMRQNRLPKNHSPRVRHRHRHHHPRKHNHSSSYHRDIPFVNVDNKDFRSYSDSSVDTMENFDIFEPRTTADIPNLFHLDRKAEPLPINKSEKIDIFHTVNSLDNSPNKENISPTLDGKIRPKPYGSTLCFQATNVKSGKIKGTSDAKVTIHRVEAFLDACQLNYEQVESKINATFNDLMNALDGRRERLIDQAKVIRDRKIASLHNLKSSLTQNETSEHILNGGLVPMHPSPALTRKSEATENKITEPWKIDDDSLSDNHECNGMTTSPMHMSDAPEEGNMTFIFDGVIEDVFSKIGCLKENLSSPQHSFAEGLSEEVIVIGDELHFNVYTRNSLNEDNFNCEDNLEILIHDDEENIVPFEASTSWQVNKGCVSASETRKGCLRSKKNCYSYSFVPLKSVFYNVTVKLNHVELPSSPYKCFGYPKLSPTFDNPTSSSRMNPTSSDSECSSELDVYRSAVKSTNMNNEWIIQKGNKSCLLRSVSRIPCGIYGAEVVAARSLWQVRVTTSCNDIVLLIGVSTRSGIPDIDEQFVSKFEMHNSFPKRAERSAARRGSSFTRLSNVFTVLLSDSEVRISCNELPKTTHVEIRRNEGSNFSLYPYCSMAHAHATSLSQVCPMPQITFM